MCTPFTISHTAYIIAFLGLIIVMSIWVIHQISSAFNLKLDNRRINKQTVEEDFPVLNEVLAKESANPLLQVQLNNAHQLYQDANTILDGPNVWTNKHHSGHKTWKFFRSHDDADSYLARASELVLGLRSQLIQ
jgi:hypothetical protein